MAKRKTVLVTGANGYLGSAVARAFSRAGWVTYGLTRRPEVATGLAKREIHPVLGSPEDRSFLDLLDDVSFDVVVSNTEDRQDPARHFAQIRAMLDTIGDRRGQAGTRPLLLFSSGCKDYGATHEKHGDPALEPQTEASPLRPPSPLLPRCSFGASLLGGAQASFDAAVLRPTIVYGLSSSYYGSLFDLAAESEQVLKIVGQPDAIMHSCHVDDCADAYVGLAEHPDRSAVTGQAFNVANARYETARQVGEALAQNYGLKLEFVEPNGEPQMGSVESLANFWQWIGSDKIRALTGWTERRSAFADGISTYRMAYEALALPNGAALPS